MINLLDLSDTRHEDS